MIIPKTANSEHLADILGVVVDDYLERRSRGEHPEIEAIARQHPELADIIRQSLGALEVVGNTYSSGGRVSHETDFGREKRLGDFRILNELGRGGMGVVYVAEQISMGGRKVALKILPFAGIVDQKQLQRFRNEVRAAASLDHPNIVAVYSFGEERGIHFYAMQLIHGQNLATVIDQLRELRRQAHPLSGSSFSDVLSASTNIQPATGNTEPTEDLRVEVEPLRDVQITSRSPRSDTVTEVQGLLSTKGSPRLPEYFRSVAELGIQAAEALEHAHQQGVVHRDIKPANLMLDAHSKLVITDFGLAQMEENVGITMTGDIVGTLRYMSPEQALGNRVTIDHRADIYSLGVSLYELLTIEPAFDGETRGALLKQVAFQEPRRLRQIDRTIPRDLETIIHKSIAKDPNERYSSAQQMADDLKAFRQHQPISARPPSIVDRSRKWVFRNQGIVFATGILMLLTTIGFAISNSLIASQRDAAQVARDGEKKQREEAEKQAEIANGISSFLQLTIFRASPVVNNADNPGHSKLTIDEVIDLAALNLDKEFSEQPNIRERLRWTIGVYYDDIGQYEKARTCIEDALEFERRTLGETHVRTINMILRLADVYKRLYEFDKAEALFSECLETRRRLSGEQSDEKTLLIMVGLADVYLRQSKYELAQSMFQQIITISSKTFGDEHSRTVEPKVMLARTYLSRDMLEEAEPLFIELLEITTRQLGKDHNVNLNINGNLGQVYAGMGEYEKARTLLEQALNVKRRVLGDDHPEVSLIMTDLANVYLKTGQFDLAKSLCIEAVDRSRKALGEQHSDTLLNVARLAWLYHVVGESDKALPLIQEALETQRKFLGEEHVRTIRSKAWLGRLYLDKREFDNAEPLLVEALEARRRVLGKEHSDTLTSMDDLAQLMVVQKKHAEAETLFRECLALREVKHPDRWMTFRTRSLRGTALLGQKKFADAEPFIIDGCAGLKRRADKIPYDERSTLPHSIQRAVDLYTEWDRPVDAQKWQKRLPAPTRPAELIGEH